MSQLSVEILESVDPTLWNSWVSRAEFGTIFQTTFWADKVSDLLDCRPYFFVVRHENQPLDQPALVLVGFDIRSDFISDKHTPRSTFFRELAYKFLGMRRHFQWFGQPAVVDQAVAVESCKVLLLEMERFCRAKKIHRVGPSELPISNMASIPPHWKTEEWATLIVDLQQGEDALWRNLKKTARKAIRSAQEKGISVRQIGSPDEFPAYFDFASRCAARYGKKLYFKDLEISWRRLHDSAVFEIFIAENDGEPIVSLGVWGYNGIIAELGSFQSERSFSEKLYGGDLIKWEVLRWGSMHGYRAFDLAGVNPNPLTEKERGIRQFKEKWGGQYQPYMIISWKDKDAI